MMPATLALIRVGFDSVRERNIAIAVWGSVSTIGMALGPIVGGLLLEFFWWGSVFLLNVPVVIAALVVTPLVAPAVKPDRSRRWDALSSLYALVTLTGAVLAIKESVHTPQAWSVIGGALVATVVGGILFVRRQRILTDPMLDFSVFRSRAFTAGVLAAAVSVFVVAGLQLVTTQRFQLVEDFSPLQAGLLVAVVALGALCTGVVGGAVLHLVGLRTLIGGGFALGVVGMVLVVTGTHSAFWALLAGLFLAGAGLGAAMSVASTAILGNVPARKAGMASAVEEVSYEFGSLIAVAILGSLTTALYSARVSLPSGAPEQARDSMTGAVVSANGDQAILDAAGSAFTSSVVTVLIIITATLAVATAVTWKLLQHHGPGTKSSEYEGNEH